MSPLNNKPTSVFDKLDTSKIGQGRLYTEGQWRKTLGSGPKDLGFKGQLKNIQRLGRHTTTKNLSDKNIRQIHGLISERIKNKVAGTGNYLSREDKMAIMKESRKLAQTKGSKFTYEDRKDAIKIVGVLRRQGKEAVFQRANNTDKTLPSNQQSPIQNKNIIFVNDVDTLRQHGMVMELLAWGRCFRKKTAGLLAMNYRKILQAQIEFRRRAKQRSLMILKMKTTLLTNKMSRKKKYTVLLMRREEK